MSLYRIAKPASFLAKSTKNSSISAIGINSAVIARNVYSDEQVAKGRFASPCLSIYHIQMGSVSSGANRLTGMGLVGGMGLLGMAAFVCEPMMAAEWVKNYAILLYPTKFMVSYCFLYHLFDGCRHFYFQYFPDKLTMTFIRSSSYVLYLGVGVIALGLAAWKVKPKTKQVIKD